MGRRRGASTFCPSEVVRWLYPQDWELFMDDVKTEMMLLYQEGLILVSQNGQPIKTNSLPKGPVRIKLAP